jgi:uncharacterized protein (DUF1697 family)
VAHKTPEPTIALLRGVNVGGRSIVPMRELVKCLESLGYENVRTYIQSGNAVFDASTKPTLKAGEQISAAISKACDVEPGVQLFTLAGFQAIAIANPYPEAAEDPSRLHIYFLADKPTSPKLDILQKLQSPTERFKLTPRAFYLHAPDGIGRSKLAAAVERLLGVPVTARNWRTVEKLIAMASESLSLHQNSATRDNSTMTATRIAPQSARVADAAESC